MLACHPLVRSPFVRAALLVVLLWSPAQAEPDVPAPPAETKLLFHASAALEKVTSLGEEDFRFALEVENPTGATLEIETADLLLAHRGGWLAPLDPNPMDGSFFRGALEVPAGERISVGSWSYRSLSPATHALLSVRAVDGVAEVAVPILRKGFAAPDAIQTDAPLGVGVVGPLEVVPFSDGVRSILLVGQHQVLVGPQPQNVQTNVYVGSDAGSVGPETWDALQGSEDRVALWPFVRRLDVHDDFDEGWVLIDVTASFDGVQRNISRSFPVTSITPEKILSPVLGAWQLGNGPGQVPNPHDDRPDHRYAYDMVVVEDGRTHKGDPHKNQSYFAWDRSIRAVADGVVVDVCDREPDNPGYRGSMSDCYNNRIVLKHANGLYTAYVHVRQRSAGQRVIRTKKVKAGQVIAKVGNSGNSSEPHLHFEAFRIDDTGRLRPVPVAFTNAFHDARGKQPVKGVVVGGTVVYFKR